MIYKFNRREHDYKNESKKFVLQTIDKLDLIKKFI